MIVTEQKIPSTKGDLATVLHDPENRTQKLAILCPGFLDSKDYRHLVLLARELAAKGFLVVRFDPTGTWESGGDIADYTITQYLEDIRHVVEYMLGLAPFKTILLGGHSRGGQMAVLYAARDPRINLVLGIMPSSGPIKDKRRQEWEQIGISISSRDLPADRNKKIEFRVPFSHCLDRDTYDAVGDAKHIKAPLVLIAGSLDTFVPTEEVKEIFDNAHEPKKFLVLENIVHDYRLNDDEVALVNKNILEQLKEYL